MKMAQVPNLSGVTGRAENPIEKVREMDRAKSASKK